MIASGSRLLGAAVAAMTGVASAACPPGESLAIVAAPPAVTARIDGLRVGDVLQAWRVADDTAARDLCNLIDYADAELTHGSIGSLSIVVRRGDADGVALVTGGRQDITWRQTGDTPRAMVSRALVTMREQVQRGDFTGARATFATTAALPLSPRERSLVIEQAMIVLEADPDRAAGLALAEQVVALRGDDASPRERARALATRGRARMLRRDLPGAVADANAARATLGDERSVVAAQVALLHGALGYVGAKYDDAEREYREAIAQYLAFAPGTVLHANALSNLAAIAMARGRPNEALAIYTDALAWLELASPGSYAQARVFYNRGLTYTELRRLRDAERDIDAATARFARTQPDGPEHLQAQAQLADVYNARGQHALAEARLRPLLAALQARAPGEYNTLAIEYTLAYTLSRLRRTDDSIAAFRVLLSKLAEDRPDSLRADTLNAMGGVLIEAGELTEAHAVLDEALARYRAIGRDGLPTASARLARGDLLRRRGDLAGAEADLDAALALRRRLAPGSVLEAVVLHVQGKLSRAQGQPDRALSQFDEAIALLERERWLQSDSAELRALWTATYADFYREPLDLLLSLDRLPQAFELDQRYRGRELAIALARGGEGVDLAAADAPPVTLADAQRRLAPDQRLVSFVTLPEHGWVVAIGRDAAVARKLPQRKAHWRDAVDALNVLWSLPTPSDASRDAAIARAKALHDDLFGGIAREIDGAARLLIVPDDALHELAFAALVTTTGETPADARYLVERHALSVAVRPFAPHGDEAVSRRVLALGDPIATPGTARGMRLRGTELATLPAARREVEAIGALYGVDADIRLGDAASERAVGDNDAGVLHFATHVVLDPLQPLDSYVLLAGGDGDDGHLRAGEIIATRPVPRDLVVLAGCASLQGANAAGEGLLGIARAWHVAGARRVLASTWAIDDEATADFMVSFHRARHAGAAADVALAQAQRAWLARARDASWFARDRRASAAPFNWAGFVLSSTRL